MELIRVQSVGPISLFLHFSTNAQPIFRCNIFLSVITKMRIYLIITLISGSPENAQYFSLLSLRLPILRLPILEYEAMFLLISLVALLMVPSSGSTGAADSLTAKLTSLQFADDRSSYIQYTPDLSSFANAISVCGWIKDIGSATYARAVFHINNPWDELTITADGTYIGIFASHQQLHSRLTVAKGTWYHMCVTWSSASRDHRYYVNGKMLGSKKTASGRTIRTGGAVTLGNWGGHANNAGWIFGGLMAYLNAYSKELSASEVAGMAQMGMCRNMVSVDEHESYRIIKWEEIMRLERRGTVSDVPLEECYDWIRKIFDKVEESERKLNETLAEKDEIKEKLSTELNATLVELEETQAEKNKMEEEHTELSNKLNDTLTELGKIGAEKGRMEEELSTQLNATLAELEKLSTTLNRTWDWKVFLSEQFFNKTFTTKHSKLITSSWDSIAGIIKLPQILIQIIGPNRWNKHMNFIIIMRDMNYDCHVSF